MSQPKKLEIPERMRVFRDKANMSQGELGELLGVSGNYISMLELRKKNPGPSLSKLFETLEVSPMYREVPAEIQSLVAEESTLFGMISTETLIKAFAEASGKLPRVRGAELKGVVGNLRELLDEIEERLLSGSGGQPAGGKAAKPSKAGGTRGAK